MTNVIGEDRSSFQAVRPWSGDYFGFCKASEGTSWKDPTFAGNWANLLAEGKPRGAYHFFHPADDVVSQARFFYSVVAARGLIPGDVFIADVELTAGSDSLEDYGTVRAPHRAHEGLRANPVPMAVGSSALRFLQEVAALAGPQHRVLLYTDLYMAQNLLTGCAAYPLFIAYYAAAPVVPAPWKSWMFWQPRAGGGPGGGDVDYFNGDDAQLRAWCHAAPPANWTETLVNNLPTLALGSKDGPPNTTWYVRRLQNEVAGYGRWNGLGKVTAIPESGVFDAATKAAVEAVQTHAKIAKDGVAGKDTWTVLIG